MTEVELTENTLIVKIKGLDQLWAFRRRFEIPLTHIVSAEVDPPDIHDRWHGIRKYVGAYIPGVITAGTFYNNGNLFFWNVHNRHKVIGITLNNEKYAKLIIEVNNPASTVAMIQQAI
ncbi:MAG: hypothetical protein AB1589_19365 [Cyanobacteriota bacterium]